MRNLKDNTYHVCDDGRLCGSRVLILCTEKGLIPVMPCRALKPSRGTLELPVTNCRNEAYSYLSKLSIASKSQIICGDSMV